MRWSTYLSRRDGQQHCGLLVEDQLFCLAQPGPLTRLLTAGADLDAAAAEARRVPFEVLPWAEAALCAPLPTPPSIRDFMAFEEHVVTSSRALNHAMDPDWYEIPVFYFSNPAAVRGPHDDVPIAPGSQQYDYELEVAAVIGTAGADLHPDEAEQHIAGYLIFCDWSARDVQAREMRQNLGPAKGKDTASSFGPMLVTPDELEPLRGGNAYQLAMRASVNGRLYSEGSMAGIYWSFGQLLAYASRGTQLRPGDVIGSGTVGTGCILELSRTHGSEQYPWLQPGDTVRLEVDQLGAIESRIVAGAEPIPLR
jgi:2-keto-4-pentenoate hydratase/2-oxohepta-3-ene-1,7-dioic acid hydratase in catechol pathway